MRTRVHIGETAIVSRKDVADRAGVSSAVVSRVLNNSGYVAQEKRERVLRVIKELDYQPHPVAVSLKNRRTKQILFYIRDLTDCFYLEMYKGMVNVTSQTDYNFVVSGNLSGEQIASLMVDGAILPYRDAVDVNVGEGVRTALAHLRSLGHRRIAFAAMNAAQQADWRLKNYLLSMAEAGDAEPADAPPCSASTTTPPSAS